MWYTISGISSAFGVSSLSRRQSHNKYHLTSSLAKDRSVFISVDKAVLGEHCLGWRIVCLNVSSRASRQSRMPLIVSAPDELVIDLTKTADDVDSRSLRYQRLEQLASPLPQQSHLAAPCRAQLVPGAHPGINPSISPAAARSVTSTRRTLRPALLLDILQITAGTLSKRSESTTLCLASLQAASMQYLTPMEAQQEGLLITLMHWLALQLKEQRPLLPARAVLEAVTKASYASRVSIWSTPFL